MKRKILLILCTLIYTIPSVFGELADKPVELNPDSLYDEEQDVTLDYLYYNQIKSYETPLDYSLNTRDVPVNNITKKGIRYIINTQKIIITPHINENSVPPRAHLNELGDMEVRYKLK